MNSPKELGAKNQVDVSLYGLDALRFFAALVVMWYHLAHSTWHPARSTAKTVLDGVSVNYFEYAKSSWFGWVGVEIFFVISGFVIILSANRGNWKKFVAGRIIRLYPAALIGATLSLGLYIAVDATWSGMWIAYIKSLALFPFGPWIDGVYWTLSVELAFYSLVGVILYLDRKEILGQVVLAVGMLSLTFYIAIAVLFAHAGAPAIEVYFKTTSLLKLSLIAHGVFFALGSLLYDAHRKKWRIKWTHTALIVVMTFGGCLEIVVSVPMKSGLPASESVFPIAIFLASVLVLISASLYSHQIATVVGARGRSALRILGLSTYPLYLIHSVLGAATLKVALENGMPPNSALALAILVPLLSSITMAIYVEPPLQRFMRRQIVRD